MKSDSKDQKTLQSLQKEVKELRTANKDNEALKVLLQYNSDNTKQTSEQKLYVASQLAAIYKTANDDKTSLQWQEIVLQNTKNPTFSEYSDLGTAYVAIGDKQNAIKYFKLALSVIDTDKTVSAKESQKKFLERQISALEKQ